MNINNILYKKTLSQSFKVSSEKMNEQNVLSICSLLNAITTINDEIIIGLSGCLDFSKISIEHFSLDVVSNASLNDIVTLKSYIDVFTEDKIRVRIVGVKNAGTKETVLLNGAFSFSMQNALKLDFSLS